MIELLILEYLTEMNNFVQNLYESNSVNNIANELLDYVAVTL